MALALYRKYRPKKLGDLVGQETNVEILKNAASRGSLGQAYLFYGPRGTGKTTTARLIAKLVNCEKRERDQVFRKIGEPCNECRRCNEVDAGNSFDVVEIDAASNRGIDEIRNLKEDIKSAPSGSPFKVYIIDEAHMLTTPAFNALLKTLEEPPRHAVFVLATTEYEKLPPTITSRTQRFLFKKLPKVKIVQKLKSIAEEEGVDVDEPVLELIAAASDGSLRDAESLLDQLASSEKKIDLAAAEHISGRTGQRKIYEFANLVAKKDLASSLEYLNTLQEEGHNMVQFTKDLIHSLRKAATLKANPTLEVAFRFDLTEEEVLSLKTLSSGEMSWLLQLLKSFLKAYSEMRYSPFAAIPLELALIENISNV